MSETGTVNDYKTTSPPPPVGAVMVVGGGIAGMQASLDLADQGFKVYLVEEKSAIGGHMAQLDKTFPTNDCAMCNISPKLVDTGRHLNIEILTNTSVVNVDGEAGNFSVTLHRKPRYVDTDKCIACGDCAEVCPVSVPSLFEEGLNERKAAYRLYPQAVPTAYAIEKLGTAPCRDACPAGQRAQGYIALIAQGRYREALRVIKEDNPFPSVCGRTCHHPCESSCSRTLVDQPVGIMALKRFVVDYSLAYGRDPIEPAARTRPEWVAIVGSGPAGLTAAHDLALQGYGVTVYEALPVAGGMMRVGIPAHRLPKGVLQQDIDDILALGINLKTNTPVKNPQALLEGGYDAVCLATGISTRDHSLGIEGEEAEGVLSAATFLRKINLGEPIAIGDRVAVLGGGITALDVAAVARRLGASEVYLTLDRPRGELPAYHWELEAVEAEGIQLIERATATRILSANGKVNGIELAQTTREMKIDKRGRRRPGTVSGTEFTFEVDTVIGTVGQYSDLCYLDSKFEDLPSDNKTLESNIPGIFVVGGRKAGASYIIQAVALGHKVADSIHRYLQGEPLEIPAVSSPPVVKFTREEISERVKKGEIQRVPSTKPAMLPMEERVTSFREVVLGLTELQARKEASRCLQCGICAECLACVYACDAAAIDQDMVATGEIIRVGAIILAPGYQVYNAERSQEYGFGRYPNVINALQMERMLSASGPTAGQVLRPSNRQLPQRIAFLQCIGSRDQKRDYCSAVCCMYATKQAMLIKEHHPEMDIHVFLMDMRAFSKGYWDYFERAAKRYGITYHHCRVSEVSEHPETHDLSLKTVHDDGTIQDEQFNLVVLSVGMETSESVRELGRRLGVELDKHGFCQTLQFNPLETSRRGIYAVGPFREPKDIPESVIEASGAASASAGLLARSRWSLTREKEFPPERDISGETVRIGVFVCHCGSNIAGFLDVPEVTDYASRLPDVVHAEHLLYACSQDSIKTIGQRVNELDLNRVVVASCSPLTHAPLFQDSIRASGLNPYLFEMANIRNHCSWVHSDDWDVATSKAKDLVRMAAARVRLLEPQYSIDVSVTPTALVVGGGVAGMTSALALAEQGFHVHLVERDQELGGHLRNIYTSLNGLNPQDLLHRLVGQVIENPAITTHLQSRVDKTSGFLGRFTTTLHHPDNSVSQIGHGVTILATGAQEYRGPEYGYGTDPRIKTQQEFEALLANQQPEINDLDSAVMIQCIGPAERYCSRICCTVALKNALQLKALNPNAQVTILYKDIRTYGFKERLFTQARKSGVLFLRYDEQHPPKVDTARDSLNILAWDAYLHRWVELRADLLVLSMPLVPQVDSADLAALFKVSRDNEGFFLEAHVKLRPVDFATEGIFMAGTAHYPKLIDETIIQAQAAAGRAARLLSRDSLTRAARVAKVDQSLCTGCLTCVRVCPFDIPRIQANVAGVGNLSGAAYIEPSVCQGCGVCAAECPAQAIQLNHYTDAQMRASIDALFIPTGVENV